MLEIIKMLVKEKYVTGKGWIEVNEYKTVSEIKRMFTKTVELINIKTKSFPTGGDYNKESFINDFCIEIFKYSEEFLEKSKKLRRGKNFIEIINYEILKSEEEKEEEGQKYGKAVLEITQDNNENEKLISIYLNLYDEEEEFVDSVYIGEGNGYSVEKELNKIKKLFKFNIEIIESF